MFAKLELRNWCAGDEMSVIGYFAASAGTDSGNSCGGVNAGSGSKPISFIRAE
ncbi:hypothetical protein D3C83_22540 [compost metagenome]